MKDYIVIVSILLLGAVGFVCTSAIAATAKKVSISQADTVCVASTSTCFTGAELVKLDKALKDIRIKAIGR
jgi:hypothetical protein